MVRIEKEKFSSLEELDCYNLQEEHDKYNGTDKYCPPNFDGFACWPATVVLDNATIPCPDLTNGSIVRSCLQNDSVSNNNESQYWGIVKYVNCATKLQNPNIDADAILEMYDEDENTTEGIWERIFRNVSTIGYGTSLVALVVAIAIFLFHRRLQNVRTKMHIHLFFSILMKGITWLIQDYIFHTPRVLFSLISFQIFVTRDGNIDISMENKVLCSSLMSLIRYFEMASYCWVLMEGLYLHQLICLAPHKKAISLKILILLGWGLPIVLMIPWITVHILSIPVMEMCLIDDNDTTYYALAVPIFITVMLNFGIFVNMIHILFVKMKVSHTINRRAIVYKKWVKSSLTLVPLFGVYNILFGAYPFIGWRYKELFLSGISILSSIQGVFVAFLFCFLNNEVRTEIKRSIEAKRFSINTNLLKVLNRNRNQNCQNSIDTCNSNP